MYDPLIVRIVVRTISSEPAWVSWTRPNSHFIGTRSCRFTSTNYPDFNPCVCTLVDFLSDYLDRSCKEWRYSFLFQKCYLINAIALIDSRSHKFWQKRLFIAVPETWAKIEEVVWIVAQLCKRMRIQDCLISASTVCSSSKVRWILPVIRAMWCLAAFIVVCHNSSKWDGLDRIKLYVISCSQRNCLTSACTCWELKKFWIFLS